MKLTSFYKKSFFLYFLKFFKKKNFSNKILYHRFLKISFMFHQYHYFIHRGHLFVYRYIIMLHQKHTVGSLAVTRKLLSKPIKKHK